MLRQPAFERAYVAAGPAGVWSYTLGGIPKGQAEHQLADDQFNVFAIAAVDVSSLCGGLFTEQRIIFAGTNDDDSAGQLRVLRHVQGQGLEDISSIPFATGPVYSLALRDDLLTDTVTLLVGTACSGVLRFDFTFQELVCADTASPVNIQGALSDSWNGNVASGPIHCRDILVHSHASGVFAFVAANHDGVFRLRLDQTQKTIIELTGTGWPIQSDPLAYKALALSPDETQLVVGTGTLLRTERQVLGVCSVPVDCSGEPSRTPGLSQTGIQIHALSGSTFGDTVNEVTNAALYSLNVLDIATRGPATGGDYFIDAATDNKGYRLLRYDSQFVKTRTDGTWGKANGVMLSTADDGVFGQITPLAGGQPVDVLYVLTETGLASMDLSSGPLPAPASVIDAPQTVLAGGLTGTAPDFLLTGGDGGVSLYNLSDPLNPTQVPGLLGAGMGGIPGEKHRNVRVVSGIPSVSATPWAYILFHRGDANEQTGGFSIWDLGPVTSGSPPNLNQALLLGTYQESDPQPPDCLSESAKAVGDVAVRSLANGNHAVYVPYGPRPGGVVHPSCPPVPSNPSAGLLIYEVRPGTSSTLEVVKTATVIAIPSALPFPTGEPGHEVVGFATYSAASHRVYAGYTCRGTVAYDLNGDLSASVAGTRPGLITLDSDTFQRSALHVVEHGGFVYTTWLGGNPNVISREAAATFGSGPVQYYRVPMNPISIEGDPTSSNHIYLFDARGGAHRLQF